MQLSRTYVPNEGPGRLRSTYDTHRFRLRLYLYNARLIRVGGFLELLAVATGIIGLSGVVETLRSGFSELHLLSPTFIAAYLGLFVALAWLARHRLGRLSRTFAASARSEELTERLHRHMQKGMQNDSAFRALERVYVPIVDATNQAIAASGGQRGLDFVLDDEGRGPFLTAVIPAAEGETLDGLLLRRLASMPTTVRRRASRFAPERQTYMRAFRKIHPRPGAADPGDDEHGDNLVLECLEIPQGSAHLTMRVALSTYGEIVRTSDSLLNEFALFAYLCRDRTEELRLGKLAARLTFLRIGQSIELSPASTLKWLPWRRAVHEWSDEPSDLLLKPRNRAAGLGVAVAMIQAEAEEPTAYVARRSDTVGTYPNVEHVVPAGMCNAKEDLRREGSDVREDFLKWTMLGELLEECYSVVEVSGYATEDWVNHIKHHCRRRKVLTKTPTFTGIAFDLLNLRPEVCAYRLVEDPRRDSRPRAPLFNVNWEYSPHHGVRPIALTELATLCDRTDFVQSGVGSLALALRMLERRQERIVEGHPC